MPDAASVWPGKRQSPRIILVSDNNQKKDLEYLPSLILWYRHIPTRLRYQQVSTFYLSVSLCFSLCCVVNRRFNKVTSLFWKIKEQASVNETPQIHCPVKLFVLSYIPPLFFFVLTKRLITPLVSLNWFAISNGWPVILSAVALRRSGRSGRGPSAAQGLQHGLCGLHQGRGGGRRGAPPGGGRLEQPPNITLSGGQISSQARKKIKIKINTERNEETNQSILKKSFPTLSTPSIAPTSPAVIIFYFCKLFIGFYMGRFFFFFCTSIHIHCLFFFKSI